MDEDFLRAIDNLDELIPEQKQLLDDEILICECFCVNVRDIRDSFKESKKVDLSILSERLCMGKGCGSCIKSSSEWLDKIF
jgi:bacterioferritin-associated ferredoxin